MSRKIRKVDKESFLVIGPGGVHCPCCFYPPGKARAKVFRSARRKAKRRAIKEQEDE